jgi:hypothetical protein
MPNRLMPHLLTEDQRGAYGSWWQTLQDQGYHRHNPAVTR